MNIRHSHSTLTFTYGLVSHCITLYHPVSLSHMYHPVSHCIFITLYHLVSQLYHLYQPVLHSVSHCISHSIVSLMVIVVLVNKPNQNGYKYEVQELLFRNRDSRIFKFTFAWCKYSFFSYVKRYNALCNCQYNQYLRDWLIKHFW